MKSNISGFPEFLPQEQIAYEKLVRTIREHFELYGFVPMETAAVEKTADLLSKGNDNEIYGLHRLTDENYKKDFGLRFDLTVPLWRYVSQNTGDLVFPHKRYHIAPVWRGERPQYGRYRQFTQCDIDIVGDGELSIDHDAEVISLIMWTLDSLKIPKFHTYINNRKILTGFLSQITRPENIVPAMRLIDKMDKISSEEFEASIKPMLNDEKDMTKVKSFFGTVEHENLSIEKTMQWLTSLSLSEEFMRGVDELSTVLQLLKKLQIPEKYIKIQTRLARGLSYYTGTVFETAFDSSDAVGSIAGGGRYDNLSSTFGSEKKYPGVGGSIGVTRLVSQLLNKGQLDISRKSTADLLITVQDRKFIHYYMRLANKFRVLGIKTETYLHDKPLGAQLAYASRKGINCVLIANEMEILDSVAIVRNMKTREQKVIRTEFVGEETKRVIEEFI